MTGARRVALRSGVPLLGALAAAVALAGCQTAPTAPAEQPPAAPAAAKQPKYGGTLRVGLRADPQNLDPHLTTAFGTEATLSLVYPRLLQWALGSDQDPFELKIVPEFAERWELEGDRTYVFHLRQGARWHNRPPVNGREVTSADVRWSFERMKGTPTGWVMEPVERIETPDPYTTKFVLKEPTAPFITNVSHGHIRIAPREIADEDKDLKKRAVGFGPYVFDQWERNVRVVLKRNPDYYLQGQPYLDEIVFQIMPEEEVETTALVAGQLDVNAVSTDVTTKEARDVLAKNARIKGEGIYRPTWFQLFLNSTRPALDDRRVRQAISKAIDRQQMVDAVAFGDGLWEGPLSVSYKTWVNPQEKIKEAYKRDLEGARKLLADAGYPNGFSLAIMISDRDAPSFRGDMTQMIVQQVKAAGIDARMDVVEDGVYRTRREPAKRDFQAFFGGMTTFVDEDQRLSALFQSGADRNYGGIKDAKLDALIARQRQELDFGRRKKLIDEIQDLLIEQMYYVPSVAPRVWFLWQDYVQNYRPHFTGTVSAARVFGGVWVER